VHGNENQATTSWNWEAVLLSVDLFIRNGD
jgi:hypothetical protein